MINLNHRRFWSLILLSVVSAIIVSCGGDDKPLYSEADVEATVTARLAEEKVSSPKSVKSPTPKVVEKEKPPSVPTATPKKKLPLDASEVFESVSESIVYLEVPSGNGSGILLDNGYVVTNAHVVWPNLKARVVTSKGVEFKNIPVVKQDMLLDLALLGPLPIEINSLARWESGEELPIGSKVFSIGYPGESRGFPKPSITQGILSNFREFTPTEVTFIQTDSAIAGGQSGGALVSEYGSIIGITGFVFTEAMLGMGISYADIESFLSIPDKDGSELTGVLKTIPAGKDFTMKSKTDMWERMSFYIDAAKDERIEVKIGSTQPFIMMGTDMYSPICLSGTDLTSGLPVDIEVTEEQLKDQKCSTESAMEGLFFFTLDFDIGLMGMDIPNVESSFWYTDPRPFSVESNLDAHVIIETNDNERVVPRLKRGKQTRGYIDYPGDVDTYEVLLSGGSNVTIKVQSVAIDPLIYILAQDKEYFDDDSGGGVFSTDAEVSFVVPETNYYYLYIENSYLGVGEYIVTVVEN